MNMVHVRRYVRAAPLSKASDMPKLFAAPKSPPPGKRIVISVPADRPPKTKTEAQIMALQKLAKKRETELAQEAKSVEIELQTREANLKQFESAQKLAERKEEREAKTAEVELQKGKEELRQLQHALSQKRQKYRAIPGGTVE